MQLTTIFLVVMLAAPAFAQAAGAVEGQVRSTANGSPLGNAVVQITLTNDTPVAPGDQPYTVVAEARTRSDGRYSIANLPAGTYYARAAKTGFLDPPYDATGLGSFRSVTVKAGETNSRCDFGLAPQAVLVVKVLDEDGEPLPDASVHLRAEGFQWGRKELREVSFGQTNDLGEYRFYKLKRGAYYVVAQSQNAMLLQPLQPAAASAEHSAATWYPGTTEAADAEAIRLVAGQQSAVTIRMKWARVFRIRGRIGEGFAQAPEPPQPRGLPHLPEPRHSVYLQPVTTSRTNGMHVPTFGRVQPDGSFELLRVPAGRYSISGNGEAAVSEPPLSSFSAQVLDIARDVEGVRLRPVSRVNLRGRMRVEGGPLDLASISLLPVTVEDPLGQFALSGGMDKNENGEFEMEALPEGTYQLKLGAGGLQGAYVKAIQFGGADALAGPVEIRGPKPPEVEVLLSTRVGSIHATVLNEPDDGTSVALLVNESGRLDPVTPAGHIPWASAEKGVARFPDLGPGKYRVYALAAYDAEEGIDPALLKRLQAKSVVVTLDEGDTAKVNLRMILPAEMQ